jgi:hypothetical protein
MLKTVFQSTGEQSASRPDIASLSHPVIIEAEDKIYIKVKLYNDNFDH